MITKADIYAHLEDKMLSYQEIVDVLTKPINEPLVPISQTKLLLTKQIEPGMLETTGEEIYVRETLAKMLNKASKELGVFGNNLQLEVVYGYKHPSIQEANFNKLKQKIIKKHPEYTDPELLEATNRFMAAPGNAGHPTGGAVDLRILKGGQQLDMGTAYREFVPDTYVFSPFNSKKVWQNRQMLRRIMLTCGFASYDGEWWHFSYGDKEWAAFYNQPQAIYGQLDFRSPQED